MRSTFQNSGMALSIGIFFSLMIAGLASTLPRTLTSGLTAQGVPAAEATHVSHQPSPEQFARRMQGLGLGDGSRIVVYDDSAIKTAARAWFMLKLFGAHNVAVLTGRQFFPHLISAPFHHGLVIVFTAAAIMSVTGALVSLLRGKQFYYDDTVPSVDRSATMVPNGLGLSSPAPGMSGDTPTAPARRDSENAPGG